MADQENASLDRRAFLRRGLTTAGGIAAGAALAGETAAAAMPGPVPTPSPGHALPYRLGVLAVEADLAGLDSVRGHLERMRRIAIKAALGGLGPFEVSELDLEFYYQKSKIDLVAGGTEVADLHLLDGTFTQLDLGLPPPNPHAVELELLDCTTSTLGLATISVTTMTSAAAALADVDKALHEVSSTLRETRAFASVYTQLGN